MAIQAPEIEVERATRLSGAAERDVAQLFESTRQAASLVSGAFTVGTRADRLAAAGEEDGDRWLEDSGWLYYYDAGWHYETGAYTGTDAQRGAVTLSSDDNGALFFATDTLTLWEVQSAAWAKLLQIVGTANQIAAGIAGGVLTLSLPSSVTVATGYQVAGTQVVGAQGAAVADAAGGVTVDTEARAAINALLSRLRTHGLIAT